MSTSILTPINGTDTAVPIRSEWLYLRLPNGIVISQHVTDTPANLIRWYAEGWRTSPHAAQGATPTSEPDPPDLEVPN